MCEDISEQERLDSAVRTARHLVRIREQALLSKQLQVIEAELYLKSANENLQRAQLNLVQYSNSQHNAS